MSTPSISILQQRRIEANIIKPLVAAFEKELGREKTREVLAQVIIDLARQQGTELRQSAPDDSLESFAAALEPWQRDDSMDMEILRLNDDVFRFNVTRCRYAEMYRELGLAELGYTLSCNRDASLIEGFSPDIELARTQTLMEGASYCDFLYNRKIRDWGSGIREMLIPDPQSLTPLFSRKIMTKLTRELVENHIKIQGSGLNFRKQNLSGLDLSGLDLQKADLLGANLRDANLSGANLSGARLNKANLSGVRLSGANLTQAYLKGATLKEAVLDNAILIAADLSGANLDGARLNGANLGGVIDPQNESIYLGWTNLKRVSLKQADLSGANLSGANLAGAACRQANFHAANLFRANLSSRPDGRRTDLSKTDFSQADLSLATLLGTSLRGANLGQANLTGAKLHSFGGRQTDLRGANLRGANLRQADLRQAIYNSHTRWDEEFVPSIAGAVRKWYHF